MVCSLLGSLAKLWCPSQGTLVQQFGHHASGMIQRRYHPTTPLIGWNPTTWQTQANKLKFGHLNNPQ
jgi:hypothetical protein